MGKFHPELMSVDPAAEEQFGPFTVYERLGVGGMATVHRALEPGGEHGERIIALKRLLPHIAEDASFIKAFVREAKLASILNHLNIVQIYELGRVGSEYFISMEYIDGRDIRRLLRHARRVTGPPPIYVTIGLMIQLCDALDYAHNKVDEEGQPLGLVHRDISPSNLIVTSQGHLKIIDFGIAKAQSSQLRTQTGRVKGKLAYMAPEAISGSRDLDARSDIWATGVILHEMITARPLFASKNEYQTLLKVQKGDILPPSTFNQSCPPELDAIVFKALARDANDRFAGAAELREELVALKKQYALMTGFRELASWIDWAFGLEAPPGFSEDTSSVGQTSRVSHSKTPRPPRDEDEDEAVEVVWGSGAEESEDGPVVLEEVPDVSKQHRSRRDTEDESLAIDDIPTPLPSHGTMPSIYGSHPDPVLPPTQQRLPPHTIEPGLARGTDRPSGKPRTGLQPIVAGPARPSAAAAVIPPMAPTRSSGVQAVARPATGVHAVVPMPARTTSTGMTVPPPARISDRMPAADAPRASERMPAAAVPRASDRMPASGPNRVDAPQISDRMAAQRQRDSTAPETVPMGRGFDRADSSAATSARNAFSEEPETNAYVPPPVIEIEPARTPLTEEELFGADAAEVLRGVSAQMDAAATHSTMPAQRRHESRSEPDQVKPLQSLPVVRFSKSLSIPPPVNEQSHAGLDSGRVAQTKPGIAVAAATLPRTAALSRPPVNQPRAANTSTPPASTPVVIAKPKRTWLYIVGGLVLAAGTAAAVALTLGGDATEPAADETAQPAPGSAIQPASIVRPVGTVKFVLEPADAEIKVEGKVVHTGSPWTSELPAGIHHIEIHKQGFKSWVTSLELSGGETHSMRVMLDPITAAAVIDDATLTITTTPAGLDVEIDGATFADKTPIKTTLKVGTHKISVKQNGTEVWQQTINAEAASDYEFNPSFTDDKKRERAQRAATPARPAPPAPAPPVPAAGSADKPAEEPKVEAPADTTPSSDPGGARPPITAPL